MRTARRVSLVVLVPLGGAVLLHCILGIVVLATAGRFAWSLLSQHGHSSGELGDTAVKLGAAWLVATVVGLSVAARLVRSGRLSR